jgi:hypothetical protein
MFILLPSYIDRIKKEAEGANRLRPLNTVFT